MAIVISKEKNAGTLMDSVEKVSPVSASENACNAKNAAMAVLLQAYKNRSCRNHQKTAVEYR